ncbi:xylulokinase [Streptomyces lonarensis]|uniref:Xylulose kinase n=1 Tax=Streptomyces lonarensis TaxID=700599 RepID=A0A7X6D331_9ACTN|nr:xylulokinase [Streptomyces lonarensis]NJQ07103.1 xylulokinase [Streptomyces lonarensis]
MATAHGPLVIGVDSSTQSTKALVVDTATGEVVASGQASHPTTATHEIDPEHWWTALTAALEQCGRAATEAEAISVAGQQHGLVTLDATGAPVRPALQWNDVRSAPQVDSLVRDLGGPAAWARRVGSVPAPSFTAPKWRWLTENEPEAAARTAAVRLPHDYLTGRLTGEGTTDRGDASGTGWWAGDDAGYDTGILDHLGLDPALLPRVVGRGEGAGTVMAAAGLPLKTGALVAAGTGDNMGAALGLGLAPGTPVLSLGTSGTVYAVSRTRPADETGTVAGFADATDGWLPLACTLNCTLAVDRIAALLGREREDVEPAAGPVLLPFLDGERTPQLPYASGLLHGLRHDTTGGQVLQAAYDGAVYALLRALDLVLADESRPDAPILLIGGGARGTAWRETVRRLSGRPVQVPRAQELVALGAAAQAAGLLLGTDPAEVARGWRTAEGPSHDAVPRDDEALARLENALTGADALLRRPAPGTAATEGTAPATADTTGYAPGGDDRGGNLPR